MDQTPYHSIDEALRRAAQRLNATTGSRLRQQVKHTARAFDGDVEPYLDEALPSRGHMDHVSKNEKHIGLATTIYYEHTGEFKDEYLSHAPWAGYGATVRDNDLTGDTISAPRAFHKAKFNEDSLQNTRWESDHQAHQAVVENNALNNAVIAPGTHDNFYNARFQAGSARDSTWDGADNAQWATIPNPAFLDHIRITGENNFAYHQI